VYNGKTPEQIQAWAGRQAYIALGFGLAAAAELQIDACPMEGFNPSEFHALLGLPEFIQPVAIMALGYRDPEDENQPTSRPKVRFPKDDLFTFRSTL
jgi:nitroreductase/dihydropteridine reductase